MKYQRKVPRGDASATLRSVSMKNIKETSEVAGSQAWRFRLDSFDKILLKG